MAEDPSPDDPLDAQQALVETSLALLFETYDDALKRRVKDPVVVLVDCEDELGGEIVRGWLGDEAVDDAIALEHAGADDGDDPASDTTVFARAFSWKDCRAEIPRAFPYLAEVFGEPPPSAGFLAIGVTAGGASALTVPMDLRSQQGNL